MLGHNMPPMQIEDFLILDVKGKSTGRIKFTNTIIRKYLTRKINSKQEYVKRIINGSEKIGLKARINKGWSKSFFYKYNPQGKTANDKRINPVPYHLGQFPEMKVDAARSLVEALKTAIKLGKDPKTVIEERKRIYGNPTR